ncbi:MAG: endonuclease/exonuclease/phosphatase family protein [Woeseiaceae bacterium]|nr:endonuclease/exonuclease/phosphatase family protein [Woeseiaceae bacterium]
MSALKQRIKDYAVRLCELGLVLTVLVSIVTVFDDQHRYVELFAHFRMQYFVASAAFVLVFIALKWRNYALLGIAATIFNGYYVIPWYLPPGLLSGAGAAAESADGTPVKLMQANVRRSNGDSARFVQLVTDEAPDILVIQEATPAWLSSLDGIASDYPYTLSEARDDSFGIALFSKFPLDSAAIVASHPRGYPEVIATALVGGKRINLIGTHPMPPIGASSTADRNLQLDATAQLAARTPRPLIVIGDLNTTMWAFQYRRFEETSGLTNARAGHGIAPTWPTFFPPALIPIDHCLVSDDIDVVDVRVGRSIGSDHLPLIVEIRL